MADNYLVINGSRVKLVDNGDGTFSLGISSGGSSSAPVLVASSASAAKVVPVVDNAAIYASGDVLFTATEIPNALAAASSTALLAGLIAIDQDDNAAADMDFYFFSKSTASMGARNAAATSITDADALFFLGKATILAANWEDVGGAKWANAIFTPGKQIPLMSEDAITTSVWVIGVTRGTPTQTTGGLIIRPFIVR